MKMWWWVPVCRKSRTYITHKNFTFNEILENESYAKISLSAKISNIIPLFAKISNINPCENSEILEFNNINLTRKFLLMKIPKINPTIRENLEHKSPHENFTFSENLENK